DAMRGSTDGILVAYENLYLKDYTNFKFPCFIQKQRPCFFGFHIMSGMAFVDLDDDRNYDEIYSEGEGSCFGGFLYLTKNIGTPETPDFNIPYFDTIYLKHYEEMYYIFIIPTVADLNGDGKPDLLVAEYRSDDRLYNVGGFRNISTQTYNFEYYPLWNIRGEFLISLGLGSFDTFYLHPFCLDLDNDKDYDLMLATYGKFLLFENIGGTSTPIWKRNETWEKNTNWGLPYDLPQYIFVNNLTAIDLDGDNFEEIIHCLRGKDKHRL
ncbi:MAG: hypothetical protein AB1297_08180, partial [bacterium]